MTSEFDRDGWERHWREAGALEDPPNPYLDRETADLPPGTALDAGCGTGAEAARLADRGWRVTGVDIADAALQVARRRAVHGPPVAWLQADLVDWAPAAPFDLVMTHYAHASIPQLQLYARLAEWVAPGGSILLVGHLHGGHGGGHGHGDGPPDEATAALADVVAVLDGWEVVTAWQGDRAAGGHGARLHDLVVRARRPPAA